MTRERVARPGLWETVLKPEMFVRTPVIAGPRPSPDGARVAYCQTFDGRSDLYTVPVDGSGLPMQVTSEHACSAGSFSWLPDASGFVYASGGKLWRIPAEGGPVSLVAGGPGRLGSPRVSPDGALVTCVAELDEDHRAVAVAPTEGEAWPRRLSRGDDFAFDAQWSPDGRWLAWVAYDNCLMPWDESELVVCRVATGEVRVVASRRGVAYAQPRWSPDGSRLAFICDRDGWMNLWVAPFLPDGTLGEVRPLGPEAHEHAAPAWGESQNYAWSPGGDRIVHTTNHEASIQLAVIDVPSGRRTILGEDPGSHADPSWLDEQTVVFAFNAPHSPTDVYLQEIDADRRTRLTASAVGGLAAVPTVDPRPVAWPGEGGEAIHGLLSLPSDARRAHDGPGSPVLLQFHGGPTSQSVVRWEPILQYFVQRGWAVLQVNYRGSSGYGKAYRDAQYGRWGKVELDDAVAAVRWLQSHVATQHPIDASRIVPWGGSNGGYAVLLCLSKAPQLFKAGVSLYGITDLFTLAEPTNRFERYYGDTLIGPSWRHADYYREWSPLTHASQIRAPVLLLHGDKDDSVAIDQSERLVKALERADKTCEYHVYEGEGHGWRRLATQLDYVRRMETFLRHYVLER